MHSSFKKCHFPASIRFIYIIKPDKYLTDYFTEEAVKVINNNKDKPFFLYLSHWAPHNPLQALVKDYEKHSHMKNHTKQVYSAMITALDRSVGKIVKALEDNGISDNTIIIFTSDHGDGLPRYKRELFDTGINVPFIILVPQKFSSWQKPGEKIYDLVSFLDIAPTVLDLAGVSIPSYMDGKSIFGNEKNEYIFAARDRLDSFKGKTRAVRNKDYKFIKNYSLGIVGAQKLSFRENLMSMKELRKMYENNELNEIQKIWLELIPELQLYDLNKDPFEINNLAYDPNYKEKVSLLENVLEQWIEKNNFHGHLEEEDLIEVFWPENTQPQTKEPLYSLENGLLHLKNNDVSKDASIGFSYDGKNWEVYSQPIEVKKNKKIYFYF